MGLQQGQKFKEKLGIWSSVRLIDLSQMLANCLEPDVFFFFPGYT